MRALTNRQAARLASGNLRSVPTKLRPKPQPVYNTFGDHIDWLRAKRERKVQRAERQERLKESVKRAVAAGLGFFKKRGVAQKGQ